ncbi:MAG: hypothetical protein HC888_08930 [Candidatus Competibacteraceae bacterium]|nr:hypothetical protein [Candidatus Competibacteraceae bacterium]
MRELDTTSEPVLLALLIADRVHTEQGGKKGINGIFSEFRAPKMTWQSPPWGIFVSFTNVEGKHNFVLNLQHEQTQAVVLPVQGEFNIKMRTDILDMPIMVQSVAFSTAGKYHLQFLIDGEVVGSRPLLLRDLSQEGKA